MSYARLAPLKLTLCCAVLVLALPSACATGVEPEPEDTGDTDQPADTAGSSTGGMYRPDQFYEYSTRHWTNYATAKNPYLPQQIPGERLGTSMLWSLKAVAQN